MSKFANKLNVVAGIDTQIAKVDMGRALRCAFQYSFADATASAKEFVAADVTTASDSVEITGHGLVTGMVGQLTTTDTLPAGVTTSTNYYIIVVDADNISFAASLANAEAGTAIVLTDAGVGDHTFTSTALSGNAKLQKSVDDINWVDISSATSSLTSGSNSIIETGDTACAFVRLVAAHTVGTVSFTSVYASVTRGV